MQFYLTLFILSVLLTFCYIFKWNRRYSVYFTILFCIIPVACFGYLQQSWAETKEGALIGLKLAYAGGCFCTLAMVLSIVMLCKFRLTKLFRSLLLVGAILFYLLVLSIGHFPMYYKTVTFVLENGRPVLQKEYGFGHTLFGLWIVFLMVLSMTGIYRGYHRRTEVSRKTTLMLFAMVMICMVSYYLDRRASLGVELMPLGYVFGQVVFLIIADRLVLYDVNDTVIDVSLKRGDVAVISFDRKRRFLGCNKTAIRFFPELDGSIIDEPLHMTNNYVSRDADKRAEIAKVLDDWMDEVERSAEVVEHMYDHEDHIFRFRADEIVEGRTCRGYNFSITDETREQQYLRLIEDYNNTLEEEVEKKTRHLVEMHDRFVLGMAEMVEGRDSSTGGHIKRTSQGVRLLIGEMRKDPTLNLTYEFARDMIKAAPMHDIGKITIDDAILRKPGNFTPEELAKMREHSAAGAKILHELLADLGDPEFAAIAENVAHYHHEHMDGTGYPEGLKGEEIPLEARIMAIADVYDALVSKRYYKDGMSFEDADRIIMEGMGTQFDKKLEPFYVAARPKLEAYYKREFEEKN